MNENEYERLKEKGYVEDGVLKIPFSELTTMYTNTEAVTNNSSKERVDKTVVVTDSKNNSKRVSSIMMGYNKAGIILKDGNFVNSDELLIAMEQAVSSLDSGTVIINKKGERLTPEKMRELFEVATETAGKITIKEQNYKVDNQEARNWSVTSADGREFNKGVVFLGNDGIKLESGDYINLNDFLQALHEYVLLKPQDDKSFYPKPIQPAPKEEPPKEKTVRVTKKFKNRLGVWLASLALTITLLTSINVVDRYTEVVESVNRHFIEYQVEYEQLTEDDIQKMVDEKINTLEMGQDVKVNEGDTFYVDSTLKPGQSKTIGDEFVKEGKEAGDYRITGISIVDENGNVVAYIEDFSGKLNTPNLGKYIDEVCAKNNLDKNNISVRLHLGNNVDKTRLGWIDVTDLIGKDDLSDKMLEDIIKESAVYTGKVETDAQNITLDNGVIVSIRDENGKLLPPGSKVIGSDNLEYTINYLNQKTESFESVTQEKDGKMLEFNIENANLALAALPLATAIATAISNKKKNDKAQENPEFFKFENEENYQKFVEEFKKSKEEYEKKSKFSKMLKNIFYRKEVDIMQQLTQEQTKELYSVIMKHSGTDFPFSSDDKIEIKQGKIFVRYQNGTIEDITSIVIDDIKDIGRKNEIVEEGRLTDEIRRRH